MLHTAESFLVLSSPPLGCWISGRLLAMTFWQQGTEKETECSGVTLSFSRAYLVRFISGKVHNRPGVSYLLPQIPVSHFPSPVHI